jgi:hypothetical protein
MIKVGRRHRIEEREEFRKVWRFIAPHPEMLGKGKDNIAPDRSKFFCPLDQRLLLSGRLLYLLNAPLNDQLTLMREEIDETLVRS